jgi:hypothetical protein
VDAFRSKAASSRIGQLGRRYSLAAQRVGHDVVPWLRSLPERTLHSFRELLPALITAAIGVLLVVGFVEATDGDISPASTLGGAFTVEVGDNGIPYIAIDPEALGQNEAEPLTGSGGDEGGTSGSSPAALFPSDGDLSTSGGDNPLPGTDPQPSPDPRPTPVPSPSPSPSPDPSPGPSPSPPPTPSPEGEPSPSPEPLPSPEPSPSPDPSPSPEPSPSPKPTKPPKPSPSPEPSPSSEPPPSPEPSPSPEP